MFWGTGDAENQASGPCACWAIAVQLSSLPTIGSEIRTHDGAQGSLEHALWNMLASTGDLFALCLLRPKITGVCHHSECPSLLLCCDKILAKINLVEGGFI